jgi:hypothetical protein
MPPANAPSRSPTFSELLFSTTVTDDGRPIGASDKIPSGVSTVYATFQYDGLANGTPWSVVWMSDGKQIIAQEDSWDDGPQGRKAVKISNRKGLPPGEYHLVLGIGGRVALEGTVLVGNPVDETDSEVTGRIVDGGTQQPVAGATIIVLKPESVLREFLRTQDQSALFTMAETDAKGRFKLPKQLPKGQAYSLVAIARNYQPTAIDRGLRVSAAAPEQADIGDLELLPGF